MNAQMATRCVRAAWLACLLLVTAIAGAAAETPDTFYKGKTITLITSTGVGGTYDVVARMVARVMPRRGTPGR